MQGLVRRALLHAFCALIHATYIKAGLNAPLSTCRKTPGLLRGGSSLSFVPALTACTSERMKTQRFSYLAGFAARELMREAKPVKLEKVAFSHFFDTPGRGFTASASFFKLDV